MKRERIESAAFAVLACIIVVCSLLLYTHKDMTGTPYSEIAAYKAANPHKNVTYTVTIYGAAEPLIIDESSFEINLVEYLNEDNYIKIPHGDGIKVLIVNSHSSERVSDSLSASDLGEDLAKILESRGVGTYFDNTSNDESGVIGAYARMSEKIAMLKEKYNEAVIVIDIHDSDSGSPFTFTIGATEGFSWEENLRLACNIYKLMKDTDAMFRFLPTSLGQDTGLLTLNIGIGGNMTDDSAARAMLASFADALSQLLQNEPLA